MSVRASVDYVHVNGKVETNSFRLAEGSLAGLVDLVVQTQDVPQK